MNWINKLSNKEKRDLGTAGVKMLDESSSSDLSDSDSDEEKSMTTFGFGLGLFATLDILSLFAM